MEHVESSIQVFFTSDYGKFKMINGNRQLNEGKINRIIKDIQDGIDVLKYYPIQVCEKANRLEIHDGQHRFFICKKLKRPVHYIVMKEERELVDIAKINSNTEKWTNRDYINCYIQQGVKDYQILRDFHEKYGISITVSLKLLQNGNPGIEGINENISNAFKRGQFKVNHYKEAERIAEACERFAPFQFRHERGFIIAIFRVMDAKKIKIEDLVAAYIKNPDTLQQCGNFKGYLFSLEQLINKGKQNRIVIY